MTSEPRSGDTDRRTAVMRSSFASRDLHIVFARLVSPLPGLRSWLSSRSRGSRPWLFWVAPSGARERQHGAVGRLPRTRSRNRRRSRGSIRRGVAGKPFHVRNSRIDPVTGQVRSMPAGPNRRLLGSTDGDPARDGDPEIVASPAEIVLGDAEPAGRFLRRGGRRLFGQAARTVSTRRVEGDESKLAQSVPVRPSDHAAILPSFPRFPSRRDSRPARALRLVFRRRGAGGVGRRVAGWERPRYIPDWACRSTSGQSTE